MTSHPTRYRVWAALLGVPVLLLAAAGGYELALTTRSTSSQLVSSRPSAPAVPAVSQVVAAPGVSDCHPLAGAAPLSLGQYHVGAPAAFPVVIDAALHVWGPRCVIAAGIVKPRYFSASPSELEWQAPAWDESRSGPGTSELVDVPGISACDAGIGRPRAASDGTAPLVAVLGRDGTLWGPRCFVSSGLATS